MSTETPKSVVPARMSRRSLIVSAAVVAVVGAGSWFGVSALNDYRADIEASQAAAKDYYEAAAEQVEIATVAADEAAEAVTAAENAATAAAAEEAAAAAAAAAQAAAEAAQAAQDAQHSSSSGTADGKCPAGTAPGQINADGSEGLCAPTGPGGATCAEYDGPTCTSWLKP